MSLGFLTICASQLSTETYPQRPNFRSPHWSHSGCINLLSLYVYLINLWTQLMGNYFSFKGTLHFHSICFHFRSGLHNQWVINIIYHSFIEPCPKTLVGEECVRSLFPFAIKPVGDVSHINVNSMTSEQVDGSSLDWSRLTLKIWQKLGSRNGGEPWRYVRDTLKQMPPLSVLI